MKYFEIVIIVIILFFLAFCFGCKEKADEMAFWDETDENGVSMAERMRRSNEAARKQAAEERKQKEEDAVNKEALIRAKSAKMLHDMLKELPEPNEYAAWKNRIDQTGYGTPSINYICPDCNDPVDTNKHLTKHLCSKRELPEPNELSYISIWEPNEITVVSLDFIPTWPDYIELEKDLVIIWPKTRADGLEWDYQPRIEMSKGTKIYFKDE